MRINPALAMALSALSAGILISCVKPAEEAKAPGNDSQEVTTQSTDTTTAQVADSTDAQITPVSISAQTQASYLTHIVNDIIIPAYSDAASQSQLLNQLAQKHCQQAPVNGANLQALRDQWLMLAQAWAQAEAINFGPATMSMSNLYINYYPDERGLVHKGVAELIAANPNLTQEQLADESAVVQGVPGLEEVLYANDSLDAGQCAYVISASSALSTRLTAIENTWRGEATELLAIDKTLDSDQGLNQWFNSLLSLVETMKSSALAQPLGLTAKAKGHVPAATAGQSRAIINAKLAVLNKVLTDPALTAMLNSEKTSQVGNELSTALADATTVLAQMPEDITQADKAEQQQLLEQLTIVTGLIKRQLIPALGIRVGFNSTDGD